MIPSSSLGEQGPPRRIIQALLDCCRQSSRRLNSRFQYPDYQAAAPFAAMTLTAIESANTQKSSVQDIPYTGGQFVAIPEFQGIGTAVGQQFSAALAGQSSADDALAAAQANTTREMARAGYPK